MAYSSTKIDYEYIINLIQNIVTPEDDEADMSPEEKQKQLNEVKQYVEELRKDNSKIADIMSDLIYEIELDESKYHGQSILNIVENMKNSCINKVITQFCNTWYASRKMLCMLPCTIGVERFQMKMQSKATIDYASYKRDCEKALPKFKFYTQMIKDLRSVLEDEVKPLINN